MWTLAVNGPITAEYCRLKEPMGDRDGNVVFRMIPNGVWASLEWHDMTALVLWFCLVDVVLSLHNSCIPVAQQGDVKSRKLR